MESNFDPELELLRNNKLDGYNYRERRQQDWLENYLLYRDRVTINRLTQRQSVNIPIMKQSIKTLLKDVDDMPILFFESLDNDKQKEIFLNEYWKYIGSDECNRMSLLDIIDKKQVMHFGRSFDQWQIMYGKIRMTIEDPQDILVSRYTDPADVNTSRYLIHTHIFVPLSKLRLNPKYDQVAVERLAKWYGSKEGLIKAAENAQMLAEKNQKMSEMGLSDVDSPILGETYVELSQHFCYRPNQDQTDEEIKFFVEADSMEILQREYQDKIIGKTKDNYWKNHYCYNSWADDLEKQDFWSDGSSDTVRQPNHVLNVMISQLVENRTLRNFGMNFYDATAGDGEFVPQTLTPQPFGWYGLPGNPSEVFTKVEIPDLSESIDEMTFIMGLVEKATGATATQQGVQTSRQVTLGEVQLALGEAKDRVKGMSKFYTPAWKRRAEIFLKLVEAGADKLDAVKLYKKGLDGSRIYGREIHPRDWMSKSGYQVRIWSQDEKDNTDADRLQKLNAAKTIMPNNPKLNEIYQRKLLEFSGLEPEEINETMEYEKQNSLLLNNPMNGGVPVSQPQMNAPVIGNNYDSRSNLGKV